jgi:anti-sigma28 factor (negative regulator of flagellin synthesis)
MPGETPRNEETPEMVGPPETREIIEAQYQERISELRGKIEEKFGTEKDPNGAREFRSLRESYRRKWEEARENQTKKQKEKGLLTVNMTDSEEDAFSFSAEVTGIRSDRIAKIKRISADSALDQWDDILDA